jgi:tetratricopeptide (TPR) repeat protein
MFQAVYYFEADSLDLALNGDGISYGFLDITEKYSMSEAANLAYYYAGACYLKKGEFEKAINHLQKFSASDLLVLANAYCLTGDANMELKNYKEAADYYEKAANYKPNKQFSPKYLMKAALAYEELEDYESAISTYDIIINQYPTAIENSTAKKYKSMLMGKMSEG